ncbi:class I SAM-dependent rRNA methyltransferase [Candidatus Peregrinibacteria bacterium]|nr:class I SAM-dependent rRNA methyltransferase [Candidatus Peregrinibacteria bacterium]
MKIAELIAKNFKERQAYIKQNALEAYRLLTKEEAGLPLAVDIYGENAVIQLFDQIAPPLLHEIETAITARLGIKNFFYKNRTNRPSRSEAKQIAHLRTDFPLPESNFRGRKEIVIQENGLKFHVNLSDYLDTGLFLDHRETRKWIMAQSKNKTVLNTFAYTGSFSVYAAKGGAAKTYSVDLSRTYCEWMKKNFAINNMPPEKNWVFKMDTFEFFKYAKRKKLRFDIIIIDPPTFSRNKGKSFSIKKDHPRLIREALALLNKNGFILFSNNYEQFQMDPALSKSCKIENFKGNFPHSCFVVTAF